MSAGLAKAAGSAVRVAKQVPVPSLVRDHNEFHKAGNVVREILMGCAMGVAFVIPWKVGEWNRMSNEQEWYAEYNRLAKEKYGDQW